MSSGKHFDEIDENALGEVTGAAGADEQMNKPMPLYGLDNPIMAKYGVPEEKDEKNCDKFKKVDENVLDKISAGTGYGYSFGSDTNKQIMLKYGSPNPIKPSEVFKPTPPTDKDSENKDKGDTEIGKKQDKNQT